ncbi:MAG: hypothetical protein P8H58_04210 [Luminiphilus sp.]|nr:hypothetical protein [Luminiphilus sp.]
MSEDDPQHLSLRLLFVELSKQLEQARAEWIAAPLQSEPMQRFDGAITAITSQLHSIPAADSIKQSKRWLKLQQKLSEGIAWLILIDLLRNALSKKDQQYAASSLGRLSEASISRCHKLLSRDEWTRVKRWWFGYLDSLPYADPETDVDVTALQKAQHRLLKVRQRVLKHNLDKDWYKLEQTVGQLRSLLEADGLNENPIIPACREIECNTAAWRRSNVNAQNLKILANSPELDERTELIEHLFELRAIEKLRGHKNREVVRDLLLTLS